MTEAAATARGPADRVVRIPHQRAPGTELPVALRSAKEILTELEAEPWGDVSPSVYETGRLVTLAPWLSGHAERVEFLRSRQRVDGRWGGPDGYWLVPTLSATDALLTTLLRAADGTDPLPHAKAAQLAVAVDRGLLALFEWLPRVDSAALPDTPAIEIIVPSLLALLQHRLDWLLDTPVAGLARWPGGARLPRPVGMDDALLQAVAAGVASGRSVPAKLLHSLEVTGRAAAGAPGVQPTALGTIGASPAATAAWLGNPCLVAPGHRAVRHLEAVSNRHGGPVPSVLPITTFERSWALGAFAAAGLPIATPVGLVTSLRGALAADGTAGGTGLPPDADTTSGTLHALALLGMPQSIDSLRRYEMPTHFCTWIGERTASATTNAHVLEAITDVVATPAASAWHRAAAAKVSTWLCDQQLPDGAWLDKWHASAYYATACCAVALGRVDHLRARQAVARAVRWVLDSQRDDGSWGRWEGTGEETAYALHILLLSGVRVSAEIVQAAVAAHPFLNRAVRAPGPLAHLWHDKDLYVPSAVVQAVCLAALHLVPSTTSVAGLPQGLKSR